MFNQSASQRSAAKPRKQEYRTRHYWQIAENGRLKKIALNFTNAKRSLNLLRFFLVFSGANVRQTFKNDLIAILLAEIVFAEICI